MAPSPAAGKTPRTPTKLSRKPQAGQASQLGQKSQVASPSVRKPSTPKVPSVEKPDTDSPSLPPRPAEGDVSEKESSKKAEDASKVEMKDESEAATSDTEEDVGGKVSQVGGELQEQDPLPVEDDDDVEDDVEDTVGGAEHETEGIEEDVEDTADDATEKAGDVGDDTEDTAGEETESGTGLPSGAKRAVKRGTSAAGKLASGDASGAKDEVTGATDDTTDEVEDAVEGTADDVEETEDFEDAAENAAEDVADDADDAEGVADHAEETANGVAETAEDAADQDVADVPDLSILKGLEVDEEGLINDAEGNPVGKLVEGDAEDLVGFTIGDDGEILDDDGDLVGRCELLPEKATEVTDEAQGKATDIADGESKPLGLNILEGLTVNVDGLIYNDDGDVVGRLTEGDVEDLVGRTINGEGEILDEDGDVIGRVEVHEDAAALAEQANDEGEEVGELGEAEDLEGGVPEAGDVVGEAEETGAEEAGDAIDGVADELPGIEALEGREINEEGQIVDDEGNVLGELAEGDLDAVKGMNINESGEVLDEEGNVVGKVELAEGAAERLAAAARPVDLRILDGLKINKKGKVLDGEGEPIGELVDGEIADCSGKKCNEKGDVLDKAGNVVGRVKVVPGEAADEALKELLERLGEATEPGMYLPGLEILDGMKINKKGKILDEEGEPIGELVDGDLAECAGKKCNDKGEVLDKDGKIIGRVKTLQQQLEEGAEEALAGVDEAGEGAEGGADGVEETAEGAEETAEDEGPELPPLSILEGLGVNKAGKLIDSNGNVVGELIEGDAKKLSKAGTTCDAEGQFWDTKGHVIGRAQTLPAEEGDEEAPFAGLEGLIVNKDGMVEDENGIVVGQVVEGNAKKLVGRSVDEDGDILDKKGSVVGHAERIEEEEAAPEAVVDLSILRGRTVNKQGNVIGDEGIPIARLIEGNAKELAGKMLDAEGQIWNEAGEVIGRCELIPENERESKPEGIFGGLQGLRVVADGMVADEDENIVGRIVEGNAKRLLGLAVDEDGDIIDKYGNVKGHAEPLEEEDPEEAVDLSILKGRTVNKQGNVIGDDGIPIARLVEGNPKELAGKKLDGEGQIWNEAGKVIGRCELIPDNEREIKPEGLFGGLQGLRVVADGMVADEDENIVGRIVEGNPKRLLGLAVDEDGDIIDKYGNVKGHAEPLEEEEEEAPPDFSILDNKILNKQGLVVGDDGVPIGRLVEGDAKELAGRRCDEQGLIHNDTGKVVGRCEVIPEGERVHRGEGPFAGYEGLHVVKDGFVEDEDGNVVGVLVEGNPKRLIGHSVDEDGDIIDKFGNVKGHADPYEEEEAPIEEVDLSSLAGCTVNKAGNVVDSAGKIVGRVAEGTLSDMIGRKVDGQGQIWDNAGNVIGRAELAKGTETVSEGPFAGFDDITVQKDGTVTTVAGDIVGRIIEGDVKKLVGHKVDEEGDIVDKNGNSIGKAERYEPEEKERRINPMSGRRVNKEGEVRDENGDVLGRLTAGDLGQCTGLEVDDNGYVIDNDGNKVGEVTLLENLVEEEEEEDMTEEELQRRQDAELADKMSDICQQTLERMQPICKQITDYIEAADRTPREELDEEELVNNVKPLIEEGGRILQECNGALRGLDPDGRIAAQAKGRAGSKEASPEEYRLADLLKELTTTVVTTIDNAKKKLNDMPHAKKKLNPLWGLLTQPLFQIIAAVGLLLAGVLGLVGQLLSALGLGGLVNGLLGGLGIDKLLGGLGLGGVFGGGDKKKKKGGGVASKLPLVGGLFGGK